MEKKIRLGALNGFIWGVPATVRIDALVINCFWHRLDCVFGFPKKFRNGND